MAVKYPRTHPNQKLFVGSTEAASRHTDAVERACRMLSMSRAVVDSENGLRAAVWRQRDALIMKTRGPPSQILNQAL